MPSSRPGSGGRPRGRPRKHPLPQSPATDLGDALRWYATHPVAFCADLIGAQPDPWQADALEALARGRHVAIRSGHGVGKTALPDSAAGGVVVSHANRGKALEQMLEIANAQYRLRGIAVIEKVPTAWIALRREGLITGAYPQKPAVADFLGCMGARAVCVEAKETKRHLLPRANIHPHQVAFLTDCARLGALCGLIVLWTAPEQRGELWAMPWRDVRARMQQSRKSLPWEPESRYRVTGCDYLARLVELERGTAA